MINSGKSWSESKDPQLDVSKCEVENTIEAAGEKVFIPLMHQ